MPCGNPLSFPTRSDFYLSMHTATPSFLSITRRAALRWRKARTYLGIPGYACETTGSARRQPDHIHMGRLTHLQTENISVLVRREPVPHWYAAQSQKTDALPLSHGGFDGKAYSCFTPLLTFTSTPKECIASANFFDLPYFCKACLTQGSYLYPISANFSSNKSRSTLWSIHHICINSLVPSVKKINIGNPGIQVNYWGGGGGGLTPPPPPPPLILLVTWISNIGFCVPGNQQNNANMVHRTQHCP